MENLPQNKVIESETEEDQQRFIETYDQNLLQENMELFTIKFLDFSKHLVHNGTICNGDFCCRYGIDVLIVQMVYKMKR